MRVAVLGTGYWGKNILRNLNDLGSLAAFCDTNPHVRAEFVTQYPKAEAYASPEEILADPTIEAVAIATPAATHGEMAKSALLAGKHVFVEKPLCLDYDEALELNRLADDRDLVLMVGHLLLYHPAFLSVKASIDDGEIGKLRYLYSNRASLGKIRREENALWSFAPHDISMMLALTGRMPCKVVSNGEAWLSPNVADTSLSHFDFGKGLQAHIFVSWLHPFKDHRLVVIGEEGMLVFDDTRQNEDKVIRYDHTVGWDGDIPLLDRAEAQRVPYGSEEPLKLEIHHFLECCRTGARPRSDALEGANVLKVLEMCQRALMSGLPEMADD